MSIGETISAALLVVSDRASAGVRADKCEPAIRQALENTPIRLNAVIVTPDEIDKIRAAIAGWADSGRFDLVLTSGGTGLSPRDVTPEATEPLLDRVIPGIPEAMRAASLAVTNRAALQRGVAGIRKKTMIINLPGSPKAAVENFSAVLDAVVHGIAKMKGDPSDCATG
jgi:molybdenum cofactor synthesis domain-containing protein